MLRMFRFLVPLALLAFGACKSGEDSATGTSANPVVGDASSDVPANDALSDAQQRPLLGSNRAKFFAEEFCEGQPDGAALPQDPRELIRPGVNAGRAIAFNAYWQDCTTPGQNAANKPRTCGEYRSRRDAGHELMRSGLTLKAYGQGSTSADSYNQLWMRWGLTQRPADFDAQVRERYGLPKAVFHNPYPLPGEDPVATHGGSGELPAGYAQVKDAAGRYTGTIGITCDACHAGELRAAGLSESGFVSGLGAHGSDMQLLIADTLLPVLPFALNSTRGVTNAMGLSGLLIGLVDADTLEGRPSNLLLLQIPGNTAGGGDTKMPAWWNASHRPRKFWDGGYSYDASRLDSAILNLFGVLEGPAAAPALREKIEQESLLAQAYIDSLQSPPYPGPIDTALAEQGAILFHAKDLWAGGGNEDIPKPPTNGSCAGCHGAYSPRYVNDPAFLDDPRLAGFAGYIAPIEQIRTDPDRLEGFTPQMLELMSSSWFSYPEGSPGYVPISSKNPAQEAGDDFDIFTGSRVKGACNWQGGMPDDAVGYLTPPLHGIWATAPYLHNGSVPDVWSLLKPEARPAMWRRQLNAGAGPERGFDTRMEAYDADRLGWKHEVLVCGAAGIPYMSCEPEAPPQMAILMETFLGQLGSLNSLGYQTMPPLGREGVEARKIFNTHLFGKRNTGHDFTRVLTDAERRAIIEYLKTL